MSLRQLWELMLKQEELKAKLEAAHHQAAIEDHHQEDREDLHQVKAVHHQAWDQVVHQAKAAHHQAWDQVVHQAKDLLQACKIEDLHQAWKVVHLQLKWAHHLAEATHWVASDESASNKI